MSERYLTLREVGDRLAMTSLKGLVKAIRSGELAAINVSSGAGRPTWRVSDEALAEFLALRRAVPVVKQERRTRAKKLEGVIKFF
ncbi:hypothetical protein BH11PLA2_BH11PLA2_44010 [soil metagenome]